MASPGRRRSTYPALVLAGYVGDEPSAVTFTRPRFRGRPCNGGAVGGAGRARPRAGESIGSGTTCNRVPRTSAVRETTVGTGSPSAQSGPVCDRAHTTCAAGLPCGLQGNRARAGSRSTPAIRGGHCARVGILRQRRHHSSKERPESCRVVDLRYGPLEDRDARAFTPIGIGSDNGTASLGSGRVALPTATARPLASERPPGRGLTDSCTPILIVRLDIRSAFGDRSRGRGRDRTVDQPGVLAPRSTTELPGRGCGYPDPPPSGS